jgi:UDP-N-acetyl-D-galactosamine dehydrogenase
MSNGSLENRTVAIIGLGYVGLPLILAFSNQYKVVGYDIDKVKLENLRDKYSKNILFTADPEILHEADFLIICVPTPITRSKEPDLSFVQAAAKTIGRYMKHGAVVILESSVYPGVTEEMVKPILEKESGRRCGVGFKIAYSPERINPGDDEHVIEKITKIVAGMDEETTDLVAKLYNTVTPNICRAKNIKTAEAAKIVENVQRDLNIAIVNELTIIFEKMGLNIYDILNAAKTKWNFHPYSPGFVGGNCIPVVPYYLVSKAREYGYDAQVILSGRAVNEYMPKHVAYLVIKTLNKVGKVTQDSRVLIMGLTYKENVTDIMATPVEELIHELQDVGVEVIGFDPLLPVDVYRDTIGVEFVENLDVLKKKSVDCIVICVPHSVFGTFSLKDLIEIQNPDPILIDIKSMFDAEEARRNNLTYLSL